MCAAILMCLSTNVRKIGELVKKQILTVNILILSSFVRLIPAKKHKEVEIRATMHENSARSRKKVLNPSILN